MFQLSAVRQVTNLNGARIFRIIQQPDRAVVFPLKIPDAATHESAQHLPKRSAVSLSLSPWRVYGTRTINSTPERASERHIDRILRVPHKHPAAAGSAAEASTIVVPRSFTLVVAPCRAQENQKDARIQSAVLCVRLWWRDGLSLTIQRCHFSLVGGAGWEWTSK